MGAAVAKRKTGPKPKPTGPREALIAMKCRSAYKAWVQSFARAQRTTPSQLIDNALVAHAKALGFAEVPPER